MSELPSGWIDRTVGDVCSIYAGYGFPERLQGRSQGDLAFFKVGDISESWKRGEPVLVDANHYISLADAKELHAMPLPANAVVFAKIGAAIALNRRALLSVPSLVDNNVMGLHQQPELLNPRYLFHFACTLKLDELSRATTVPSLRKGDVASLRFPLAPLNEQNRIVAEIEKQFTRLDAAVAALKRVQANLKRYRSAVLKAACEGRLVPTEAELARKEGRSYETGEQLLARILKERRAKWESDQLVKMHAAGKPPENDDWKKKYKEPPLHDISQLPKLPDGWVWVSVEMLSTKVVDGVHKKPNYVADGIPFVTVRNLTARPGIDFERLNHVTESDHAEFIQRANPEYGDILVSKDGTLGVIRAIRTRRVFSIFVSVAMIKPVVREMSDYLEIALMSPQVQIQMAPKGSGLQHIHLEDLREDCIPLPPIEEQSRIVTEVQRNLSNTDFLEAELEKQLSRADRLRQSILKRAFEGKLVPQDPNDEPASVLLERIRAERAASHGQEGDQARQRRKRAPLRQSSKIRTSSEVVL